MKIQTRKVLVSKEFNESSYLFGGPEAAAIAEPRIQKWIDEVVADLDAGNESSSMASGNSKVIGTVYGKGASKEYCITVIRDGYEEITLTPKK